MVLVATLAVVGLAGAVQIYLELLADGAAQDLVGKSSTGRDDWHEP